MMSKTKVAQAGNYVVEVEEGKTYYLCQCGERAVISLSATVHIVRQILTMLLLLLRKLARYIFVGANKHPINLFVMEVI